MIEQLQAAHLPDEVCVDEELPTGGDVDHRRRSENPRWQWGIARWQTVRRRPAGWPFARQADSVVQELACTFWRQETAAVLGRCSWHVPAGLVPAAGHRDHWQQPHQQQQYDAGDQVLLGSVGGSWRRIIFA